MKKRDLFAEMMQGVSEMAAQREGKITLRQNTVEDKPAPEVSAQEIVALRGKLHMSQTVFARRIRTSPGTLRNAQVSQGRYSRLFGIGSITHDGLRWNSTSSDALRATRGTIWIALAPLPITATLRPSSSCAWFHRAEWKTSPSKSDRPAISGTCGRLS